MDKNSGTVAARGEGLAGLVAHWRKQIGACTDDRSWVSARKVQAQCADELEDMLAVGMALPFNKEEIDVLVQGFSGDTGWLTAQLNKLIEVKLADRPSRTSVSSGDASMSARAALEAAAPASTPHELWESAKQRERLAMKIAEDLMAQNMLDVPCKVALHVINAALATPSPQAPRLTVGNITGVLFNAGVSLTSPVAHRVTDELNAVISWQEQCNAFSTTSAREQSAATASGNLSAAEFNKKCICRIERLGNFGNYKRWRDKDCPVHGEKEPVPAATQEPAGSGHVDILAELDHEKYTGPTGKIMQAGSPRKVGEDGGCLCFDTGCDLRGYCLNTQCDEWKQANAIARRFHEAYERLAPDFGYETRRDSAVHWDHLPEKNRKLILATCATLLRNSGVPIRPSSVPVGEQKEQK